jgi:hypothetical protein
MTDFSRFFGIRVAICMLIWIATLPLLMSRRARLWLGIAYLWSSFLTGFTCWIFCAITAYRTLGGFWLLIGVIMGGIGVFPLALIGIVIHRLWSSIPDLVIAIVLIVIPRIFGNWLLRRCEQRSYSRAAA